MTARDAWNIWNFRRPIVDALMAAGHRVTVVAPGDSFVSHLRAAGCDFQPLDMGEAGSQPLHDPQLTGHMHEAFTRLAPDVILGFTFRNVTHGALAAGAAGIPFIANVGGLDTNLQARGAVRKIVENLYRQAFCNAMCVYFQNHENRDIFIARRLVDERQARLLPGSGIDLAHFAPAPTPDPAPAVRQGFTFLMVARLLHDKGVREYVAAARQLRNTHPHARFRLLGTMGLNLAKAIPASEIAAWVQDGSIEYLGSRADVRPELAAADCVVLPSYREGTPHSLLEAAAMARPIITTDTVGCRNTVDDRITGLLCRPRDAADLARQMAAMLALPPARRQQMGAAGRAKMQRQFDKAIVANAYLDTIAEIGASTGRIALAG